MDFNLWAFILDNLEAAGVIGGYVSISIIGVSLITLAFFGKAQREGGIGPQWAHPLSGGLLGIIPGCGATIVVSALYKNKNISFGGLFATFIATLGEGSFVLLGASDEADVASNLTALAIVNVVGLVVGVLSGAVIDAVGFEGFPADVTPKTMGEASTENGNHPLAQGFIENIGFYGILAFAVFLAPGSIMALWGGGIDALEGVTVWVAIALTVLSIILYAVNEYVLHEDCCEFDSHDVKSALHHAVNDIALVISYVFLGLFVANFVIDVVVGPEQFDAWMQSATFIVVVLAGLLGAIPGCGGMIAVAVAFITIPNFPMAALIAAAIATSGDGIFPLLAQNKRDAIFVTGAGFVVSVVVGYAALAVGL